MSSLPKFYRITSNMILCDPSMSVQSNRTQDIRFFDLANNYELQKILGLGSSVFLNPKEQYAVALTNDALYKVVASFIAAFKLDEKDAKLVYDHLMTNPIIRIIFND